MLDWHIGLLWVLDTNMYTNIKYHISLLLFFQIGVRYQHHYASHASINTK